MAIGSFIEENDDDDDDDSSSRTTVAEPGETLLRIPSQSVHTRGEEEHGMRYLFRMNRYYFLSRPKCPSIRNERHRRSCSSTTWYVFFSHRNNSNYFFVQLKLVHSDLLTLIDLMQQRNQKLRP